MIDILVILDRSGSMEDARADHEGGLRSFVRDQQEMDGDVRLTFVRFDDRQPCEIVIDRLDIRTVKTDELTLVPRGGTPLFAAMGRALAHLQSRQMRETSEATIVMVITDGEANGDNFEWTKERVKARVAELEKIGWKFLFLGANVDAFAEGDQVGVQAGHALNYANTPKSVGAAYAVTASNVLRARGLSVQHGWSAGLTGQSLAYTEDQRAAVSGTLDTTDTTGTTAADVVSVTTTKSAEEGH